MNDIEIPADKDGYQMEKKQITYQEDVFAVKNLDNRLSVRCKENTNTRVVFEFEKIPSVRSYKKKIILTRIFIFDDSLLGDDKSSYTLFEYNKEYRSVFAEEDIRKKDGYNFDIIAKTKKAEIQKIIHQAITYINSKGREDTANSPISRSYFHDRIDK